MFLRGSYSQLIKLIGFIESLTLIQFLSLFFLGSFFFYLYISKIIIIDLENKLRKLKEKNKRWPLLEDLAERESLRPLFLLECFKFLRDLEKTKKEYPNIWYI